MRLLVRGAAAIMPRPPVLLISLMSSLLLA
jgi:hypothetical protein